jgi:hypothetical protein
MAKANNERSLQGETKTAGVRQNRSPPLLNITYLDVLLIVGVIFVAAGGINPAPT